MKNSNYVFQARIMPILVFFVPIILETNLILFYFDIDVEWTAPILNIIIFTFVLIMAEGLRARGKSLENKLFDKWGGSPTTRFLRLNNDEYNYSSKINLRNKIKMVFNSIKLPTLEEEKNSIQKTDEIYKSAVSQIREVTRNKEKYYLVQHENTVYGMWRNLLAIKKYAIVLLFVSIILNIILFSLGKIDKLYFSIMITVNICAVAFWFMVKESKVKNAAEIYAKRLFETFAAIDEINRYEK